MIEQFHSMGVRVICWITSLVNNDSSNYQYGKDHMYFLSDGIIHSSFEFKHIHPPSPRFVLANLT
jgi:alpha-glucosidase (family GH31 glycosyl hydrolase)